MLAQGFLDFFFDAAPHLEYFSNFSSSTKAAFAEAAFDTLQNTLPRRVLVDNPRASYRAENPTDPKIGQKYQPEIRIPPTAGDRKHTPKIPEKYPQNTNSRSFGGLLGVAGI